MLFHSLQDWINFHMHHWIFNIHPYYPYLSFTGLAAVTKLIFNQISKDLLHPFKVKAEQLVYSQEKELESNQSFSVADIVCNSPRIKLLSCSDLVNKYCLSYGSSYLSKIYEIPSHVSSYSDFFPMYRHNILSMY